MRTESKGRRPTTRPRTEGLRTLSLTLHEWRCLQHLRQQVQVMTGQHLTPRELLARLIDELAWAAASLITFDPTENGK